MHPEYMGKILSLYSELGRGEHFGFFWPPIVVNHTGRVEYRNRG
jgi:hypothetical protein